MTQRAMLLTATLFLSTLSANGASPLLAAANGHAQPVVQQISPDIKLIKYGNGVQVEQLEGNTALAHLQNLIARHPDAFVASRKELLRRGVHPTNRVFVERTYREISNRAPAGASPYGLVQSSSEQNSDGEIDFWSYEGANNTWQGTIYMELYSNGAAATWDGQIDTSSQDYPYIWVTQTWSYNGNGHDPYEMRMPPRPPLPGSISHAAAIQFAAWTPGQSVFPVNFNWYNWSTCWRATVVGGCSAAAISCVASGPLWPPCFAYRCIGAEVGGGITCAFLN